MLRISPQRLRFAAVCVPLVLPVASLAQKDIVCGASKVRYAQPADCARACNGAEDAVRCQLIPNLKALSETQFESLYNFALFFGPNRAKAQTCGNQTVGDSSIGQTGGMQVLPPAAGGLMLGMLAANAGGIGPRDKVIARVFGMALLPNQYSKFQISWGEQTADSKGSLRHEVMQKGGEWADAEKGATPGTYTLSINPAVLCSSPAEIFETLGHEMTHVEQYDRVYKDVDLGQLRAVSQDLREVEAYSWELGQGGFKWRIGPNRFRAGLTDQEKSDAPLFRACYERDALAALHRMMTQPFHQTFVAEIDRYFAQDAWISSSWLPSHKDWKTAAAPPLSAECKAQGFE